MDREPLILGIIGVIVLVATLGVLTLSGGNSSNTGTVNNQCNMTDEQFIEHMVAHHEQAIAMAQVAQEKSEHPEVKQLAGNIISTQNSEISKMREWYKNWYGKDVPVNSSMINMNTENCNINHDMGNNSMMNHTGETMKNMTDLNSLKNADPFDKAFLEQMIAHHEMAVMMAQGVLNSERPEIRELANSIIKAQTAEIELMKEWLGKWYGSSALSSSNATQSNSDSNQATSTSSNSANVDHASHHSTSTSTQAASVPSNNASEELCHEE